MELLFKIYLRKLILVVIDLFLINLAFYLTLAFRFEWHIPLTYYTLFLHYAFFFSLINILIYYFFGLYTSLWRYASLREIVNIVLAVFTSSIINFIISYYIFTPFPLSIYLISFLFTFILIGGVRLGYKMLRRVRNFSLKIHTVQKRIMIIGAGTAGSMIIKELKNHENLPYLPVVVIDEDKWKQNTKLHGVPVKGNKSKIISLAEKYKIDEIILSIPSATKQELAEILKICKQTKCKLKTLPGIYELINNTVTIKEIRDVKIEDLLGRDEIKLNTHEISHYIKNKTVLVTGGGGSIGSELCRQIAKFHPKKILILDIYENSASDLEYELKHYFPHLKIELLIASVRDYSRLDYLFKTYQPEIVFHAAAHKHVPIMENNPLEAIKNNIYGTINLAELANKYHVLKFVLISTDKAVNPTNIMGATKRVAEKIIQSMDKKSETEFVAVRFGNVLGSNGSVIPIFKNQIAMGGPVTVTHPEVTRFFMTIPEAVQLVIQAGAIAKGGEIFILDMGESVKIVDLARDLIRLSGFEPDVDIKIEFSGLRPGEKLYEELLLAEEGVKATKYPHIFVGNPLDFNTSEFLQKIKFLEKKLTEENILEIKQIISQLVPTYRFSNFKI